MNNRNIVAPDLDTAAFWFVSNLNVTSCLGHFLLSTDHSPSEQICGVEWHHSVLVISENVEHQQMADELGAALNPATGMLKQWKDADGRYKNGFHKLVFHSLKKYPILVYAVSARESAVLQHEVAFAQALGIAGCYKRVQINGKSKVEFGPFTSAEDSQEKTLIVSEKHAPMAIHLAYSLLRFYTSLQETMIKQGRNSGLGIFFQIMSDRPPTDFTGPYADLMYLLLGGPTTSGKFTWGGFTGGVDQPIDLLADNLAGLLNDITAAPEKFRYQGPPLVEPINGVFFWERYE